MQWFICWSCAGFTALREALGMTSPNDTDVPAADSEDLDDEEDYEEQHAQQQQQQQQRQHVQQAPAVAEAPAVAAPGVSKRVRDNSEEARAARAAAAQKEIEEAKSLAGAEADSWDEDFQYNLM
jgi:FtsZ-interacting cell division protein YlmF